MVWGKSGKMEGYLYSQEVGKVCGNLVCVVDLVVRR